MRIRSVTVGPEAVEAVVVFEDGEPLRTSDGADALGVLALLPGLKGHRCANDERRSFGEELGDTELAHVLEHAALELMALAGSPDTLRGETVWDFHGDGRGVFRVRLQYDDDIVALGALRVAGRVVRWVMGTAEPPDIEAEVARLRALRTAPRRERLRARRNVIEDRAWRAGGAVGWIAFATLVALSFFGLYAIGWWSEGGRWVAGLLFAVLVLGDTALYLWLWRRDQRG